MAMLPRVGARAAYRGAMSKKALLPVSVVSALRAMVPRVASRAEEALAAEIGAFASGTRVGEGSVGVEQAIGVALTGLLRLTEQPASEGAATPGAGTLDAAYAFGQFEAQHGRTVEALLAAYRVGARVAWRDFSAEMVTRQVAAGTIAQVAELVFAYIDHLSAASIAGHADELASKSRERQQNLERLTRQLLSGAPIIELVALAEAAEWHPPDFLIAVVLPAAQVRPALQRLDHRTLIAIADLAPNAPDHGAALLVPDSGDSRPSMIRSLGGIDAVVGPSRPWTEVHTSYARASRALALLTRTSTVIDTDELLVELVVHADPDALHDLRSRALAPLAHLRPTVADRLAATLRSWLIHQGRRDDVAADLNVHAQTVRYRMGQIRELFGAQLDSPRSTAELFIALSTSAPLRIPPDVTSP